MSENQWRGQRQPTAVVVQIVGVLVVADQYRVYRPKSIGAHRGAGNFGQVSVRATHTFRGRSFQYGSRSWVLRIFPLALRGSSGMKSTVRGHL
jgi:hypothetical protein